MENEKLTIADAISDPDRPLSMAPEQWLSELKQRRGSFKEAVDSEPGKISDDMPPDEKALVQIDMGIDSMIAGIKNLQEGLDALKKVDLDPKERAVADKIRDLLETAVAPYTADIVKELDSLEEEE